MEITPRVRSSRFAQLNPGDLFIFRDDTGSYIALAVRDTLDGDKMMLLLGPASPVVTKVPILTNLPSHTLVVSFGKDYKLRLPCDTGAWFDAEPSPGHCVVLSGNKSYIRALYGWGGQLTHCFVGVEDGLILKNASGKFRHPSGDCAYAVEWEFLTTETDPREILSSSHSQQPQVVART